MDHQHLLHHLHHPHHLLTCTACTSTYSTHTPWLNQAALHAHFLAAGGMQAWPAMRRWHDLTYLRSVAGH